MINLNVGAVNEFAIYADTIDNSVQQFGEYFLIGFKSTYTNHWTYVIPTTIKRNSRFVQFNLDVVEQGTADDPFDGILSIFPPGNYSYKCWNLDTATLDPSEGILIDEGQMIMGSYSPPEVIFTSYISDNETFQNIIYYSGVLDSCFINYANSPYIIEVPTTNLCQPLTIEEDGFLLIEEGIEFTLN
jgi:hypothetical protein